jgi:predicted dehydrogenase
MTVRLAQVGCGYWGKNLARNFAQLGALHAVVDDNPATAAAMATEHGALAMTFASVLDDPNIEAVSLATPAPQHARMALAALNAGKHVFVEKPLALEVEEARQLVEAAKRSGQILMVGHLLQYHPIFNALLEIVKKGELGNIKYIYSNRLSFGKIRVEENVLWSFAPHDVSMVLALAGEMPQEVKAEGASFVTQGVADNAICHLNFPSGIAAHINVSWMHPFKEHRLVIVGEKATAVFEDSQPDWSKRLAIYRNYVDRAGAFPSAVKGPVEFIEVASAEPLKEECSHFLDCIQTGNAPRTNGAEGLRVLNVLRQAEDSLVRSLNQAGKLA